MSSRISFRVATAVALVFSALTLTPLGANAGPAGVRTSSSLRSPAWMRQAPVRATAPVGGALTEAELPGASNPSEPYAAASQAVELRAHGGTPLAGSVRTTVNPVTGDLSLSLHDLLVPERGVPLGLSLTYNSYFASKDGAFGRGWSFNSGMSLTRATNGSVTITQENGSQVTFQHTREGYVAAPRVIASLRNVGGTFVFTRGTKSATCPRYSRSCAKFFFSEPVSFTPGRLTKIVSPDGGLTLVYTTGRLTAVKDPAGRTLSFVYKSGKVTATALDANGGLAAHTTYDTHGNLTRFTNAGGDGYRFLYASNHLVTGIVDPRGAETDIVYDTAGHVQSITDPAGETDFARGPRQTTASRVGGQTITAHYTDGEVTRIDQGDPAAPLATTLISYAPAVLGPTAVTDPDGHTSHMSYDSLGHLTSFTDPLSHTSTYHFAAASGIITATDPLGNISTATTDTQGRVVSIAVDSGDAALTETTIFHYGNSAHPGDVTSVTDPEGHLWRFSYDKFGNRTSFTDPLGDTSSAVYDRMGRPAINTIGSRTFGGPAEAGFSTTYTYDPEGRMVRATDPLGNTESFSYDPAGNLVATVAGGRQTSFVYDAASRLIHHAQGTYAYRSDGHLGEVCDDGGGCDEYTYDDLGWPKTVTDPLGNTTSFVHSPAGVLVSSTDANGVTTSYAHDAAGHTTGISYSDGITHPVTFDYDAKARPLVMTDTSGSSTFAYDSLGRLTHESNGSGAEIDYAYDRLDHVTSMKLNSTPMASYTYDDAGRMASVIDRLGNATTFSYDASSNLIQTLFPGGDVDRDGYDAAGRLVHFSLSDSTSDPASIDILYRRNSLGQITGATQIGTGQPDQTYAYDANGRLSAENTNPRIFDSRNNLLQDASGNTFTYDAADRLVSEDEKSPGADVNWMFGYDDNGSRTSAFTLDGTRSQDFVWDAAGNLTSFTDGSASETNDYDGLGRKVSSTSGGTKILSVWASTHTGGRVWGSGPTDPPDKDCNGNGIFAAVGQVTSTARFGKCVATDSGDYKYRTSGPVATGSTTFIYGPEDLPVEQIDGSGQALFYHHDQLGSTRAVSDGTPHTVVIIAHDACGNEKYHSGTVSVPFGFGGGYTDSVGHVVLIGHDYYDPSTCQFLKLGTANGGVEQPGFGDARRGGIDDNGPDVGLFAKGSGPCKSTEVCGNGFAQDAYSNFVAVPDRVRNGGHGGGGGGGCGGGGPEGRSVTPTLTPDVPGTYQFSLVVSDSLRVVNCGSLPPVVDGAPPVLLGPSPYALGGGDPINARVWRSRSGAKVTLDDDK